MHLFLSPHLDDAVLSCGGLIHQLVQRGESVRILTVMAGDPPDPLPHSPIVDELHTRWQSGASPVAARREEDRAAAMQLGAEVEHLGIPDCPYRVDDSGKALYPRSEDLFGPVHQADPALQIALELPAEAQIAYIPLGVGGHVDHKVVSVLGQRWYGKVALLLYEEYPYGGSGGEAARNSPFLTEKLGNSAVQTALAALSWPVISQEFPLSESDLRAKIEAIGCYKSQISTFWEDLNDMEIHIRRHAQERLWKE
jgi:LmbE family N-acetylglucosaminyl deacetylase